MPDVAFVLQDTQQGARGRIAGGIGQRRLDLSRGGAAPAIQDIQNLAFSAAHSRHAKYLA